jgi:hypothetical protein
MDPRRRLSYFRALGQLLNAIPRGGYSTIGNDGHGDRAGVQQNREDRMFDRSGQYSDRLLGCQERSRPGETPSIAATNAIWEMGIFCHPTAVSISAPILDSRC